MELPKFNRSLAFFADVQAPCLRATLPNSVIPRLAAKEIEKVVDEPQFSIVLRSKNPKRITAWQKKILQQLIQEEGLASAIEDGMRNYFDRDSMDGLSNAEKQRREESQANGILPYVILSDVVIDDSLKEVVLVLSSELDGNLAEHGISIYLENAAWKFDSDYIYEYLDKVEEEESERDDLDFEEEEEGGREPKEQPNRTDLSWLCGTWEHDPEAHRARLKSKGEKDNEIRMAVEFWQGKAFEVSEKFLTSWYKGRPDKPDTILRITTKANKVAITFEQTLVFRGVEEKEIKTWNFVHEVDCLIAGDAPFKKKDIT